MNFVYQSSGEKQTRPVGARSIYFAFRSGTPNKVTGFGGGQRKGGK